MRTLGARAAMLTFGCLMVMGAPAQGLVEYFSDGLDGWTVFGPPPLQNPEPVIENLAQSLIEIPKDRARPTLIVSDEIDPITGDFDIAVAFAGVEEMFGGSAYGLIWDWVDEDNHDRAYTSPGFHDGFIDLGNFQTARIVNGQSDGFYPINEFLGENGESDDGNTDTSFAFSDGGIPTLPCATFPNQSQCQPENLNNNDIVMPDALRLRREGDQMTAFIATSRSIPGVTPGVWIEVIMPTIQRASPPFDFYQVEYLDTDIPEGGGRVGFGEFIETVGAEPNDQGVGARFAIFGSGPDGVQAVLEATAVPLSQSFFVPEPSTALIVGAALAVCGVRRRR
ncbi:MAG: hypothetical protein CMJ18_05280 [Phycisphaeraceae bacterium]|nr:hypothetical protein [Phycisphaeraceae bacterium]